jgi:hypothetical protein
MKTCAGSNVPDDDKALNRLIACALVAEPRASIGRIWRLVPETRVLRSDELRQRIRAQSRRAESMRVWLHWLGSDQKRLSR